MLRGRRLKNNLSARKFFEKYLKNILKSVDFYQKIWYNVLVRLRGKPQSHLDLPIEEREQVDPHVHNNPPKILHPLNLISPSLKINHRTLQERLRFVLCLVGSYLLLLEKQSVERSAVFFCYINEPTLNQKKWAVHDQKNRGGPKKKPPPVEEKNSPLENKKYGCAEEKIGCDKKKLHSI